MNKHFVYSVTIIVLIGLTAARCYSVVNSDIYGRSSFVEIANSATKFNPSQHYESWSATYFGWLDQVTSINSVFKKLFSKFISGIIVDSLTCLLLVILIYRITKDTFASLFSLIFYVYSSSRYEVFLIDDASYNYSNASLAGVFSLWFIYLIYKLYNSSSINRNLYVKLLSYLIVIIIFSVVMSYSSAIRQNLLFALLPVFIGIYFVVKNIKKSALIAGGCALAFIIISYPTFSINYSNYGGFTRPPFTTIFLGIGGHPNPWGIKQSDSYNKNLAKASGIKFPWETAEDRVVYNNFFKEKYFEFAKEYPHILIRNALINNIIGLVRYSIVELSFAKGLSKAISGLISYFLIACALLSLKQMQEHQRIMTISAVFIALYHVSTVCVYWVASTHYLYSYIAVNIFILSLGVYSLKNWIMNNPNQLTMYLKKKDIERRPVKN